MAGLAISGKIWSTLKILQWDDLPEKRWPWPPYCERRFQLLIDFPTSSACTPNRRGGPLTTVGGGACSEIYAITQLITSWKRLVPLPSWVMYALPKKKTTNFSDRSTRSFITLVAVKLKKKNHKYRDIKRNLIFIKLRDKKCACCG
jgi:hypothetical protein